MPKPKPFDGKEYMDYPAFKSTFHAMVDGPNSKLTTLKNFSLLRESLEGSAFDAIKHLMLDDDENYKKALDILDKRFMKKRLIFKSLIKSLFEVPKVAGSDSLRSMMDKVNASLRALEGLRASPQQIGDGILIHHVLSKVDSKTLHKWEEASCSTPGTLPEWKEIEDFLEARSSMQESMTYLSSHKSNDPPGKGGQLVKRSYTTMSAKCAVCFGQCQGLENCQGFKEKSPRERYEWVKANHICVRCFTRLSHRRKYPYTRCEQCNAHHHTLLHFNEQLPLNANISTPKTALNVNCQGGVDKIQILGTVIIMFQSRSGEWVPARILVDSGSITHFITKRLASKLRLHLKRASAPIIGLFGGHKINEAAEIKYKSTNYNFDGTIEVLILPEFDHLHPSVKLKTSELNIPSNLPLADPSFDVPQRDDGIIGVGLAYKLLMVGQVVLTDSLILQKTLFGWMVAGEVNSTAPLPNKFVLLSTQMLVKATNWTSRCIDFGN